MASKGTSKEAKGGKKALGRLALKEKIRGLKARQDSVLSGDDPKAIRKHRRHIHSLRRRLRKAAAAEAAAKKQEAPAAPAQ